jgi:hypothetical protein
MLSHHAVLYWEFKVSKGGQAEILRCRGSCQGPSLYIPMQASRCFKPLLDKQHRGVKAMLALTHAMNPIVCAAAVLLEFTLLPEDPAT